ncbi:MAG: DUF3786 domain-containing protein [Thermodesulfovibrionales bacterium]|nr:DUF3786 domain-containing protein [Thermodesulfovibrionales bacterium]
MEYLKFPFRTIKKYPELDHIKTSLGEQKAWDLLAKADPKEVCRKASVDFDHITELYKVKSFGIEFFVSPQNRKISTEDPLGNALLEVKEYFFELSIVWYLISAKDVGISGRWVKPEDIQGGQIFSLGTHKLPLDRLAIQYAKDSAGFIEKAKKFGGIPCNYADACIVLYPFVKVPIQLLLWLEDDEFPPRVDLMLDSTCDTHLPTDVIWAITTTTVLIMF